MTHIAPLVAVLLTSSLLRWTAAEASILCAWTKVLPNADVHYSFLRQGSPSLRLYHSVWSRERALLGCSWSEDASVIQNYFSLCLERTQEFTDHPDENVDLDSMFGAEEQCVSLASPQGAELGWHTGKRLGRSVGGPAENSQGQDERSEVRTHLRVKRGFIVPGTLWCGSGNKAPSYADLGVFAETDSCCREHDQCKHTILSFHSDFGVFNSNIFTMSHCDCDNKFRSCLMEANDSISDVVGYTFFNLLKMHCFEFSHRLQCTQRNWFGMCKETNMALYAEVHAPTLYESTSPTEASVNRTSSIINTTTPAELPESSTSDPQLFSITAAASTVPTPSTGSPSASITPATSVTTSTVTNTAERPTGSVTESRNNPEYTSPIENRTVTEPEAAITETRLSCGLYKDLDECRNKVLPQQTRYGLHNPGSGTLYHCNCTTRLFQTLGKQRQLTEVQGLLLGHVSQSCFLSRDCTAGKTCSAVLVQVDLPQLEQRSGAEVEQQRHLQAVKLKVRRAKRKDRAVRLHKLCLRLTRPKQPNKTRKHGQNAQRPSVRGREHV
ncbi:group 3 secretory phospholipase A2 isoform X2 [Toxotes jaculatrix]|uniref:group 3 secretory phospholipase A2 isoform X2 n=1 Tax=Toxotes jaculatrix TaxID=941984 RepID=UPI001B3A93F5|nr:group 3 secretory phospholipase A2 isoform X2 [Toxotes jaculatrix]